MNNIKCQNLVKINTNFHYGLATSRILRRLLESGAYFSMDTQRCGAY